MINLRLILLILAFVLFALATFQVPATTRINMIAAGLAIWVLALMVTTTP